MQQLSCNISRKVSGMSSVLQISHTKLCLGLRILKRLLGNPVTGRGVNGSREKDSAGGEADLNKSEGPVAQAIEIPIDSQELHHFLCGTVSYTAEQVMLAV